MLFDKLSAGSLYVDCENSSKTILHGTFSGVTVLEIYINVHFFPIQSFQRVYIKDNNLRTQPKFIVFLSQLLLLFKFCPSCKADNPLVETRQAGTMAVITSTCTNKKCNRKDTVWKSQPNIPGTRIPAGNFLLCMSILLSGS